MVTRAARCRYLRKLEVQKQFHQVHEAQEKPREGQPRYVEADHVRRKVFDVPDRRQERQCGADAHEQSAQVDQPDLEPDDPEVQQQNRNKYEHDSDDEAPQVAHSQKQSRVNQLENHCRQREHAEVSDRLSKSSADYPRLTITCDLEWKILSRSLSETRMR